MVASANLLPVLGKSFDDADIFKRRTGTSYALLPFRFLRLENDRYVATNFVGEYAVLSTSDLRAFVQHTLQPHDCVYDELKSKHFLIDSDSTVALDLLACKLRTKQCLLPQLTSLFLLVVTLRCEHSCPYCQVSRQSQDRVAFDMKESHALRALDFAFDSPAKSIKIEFQGGEPLLNFELIRTIVQHTANRNAQAQKSIQFVIATNLALITDEVLSFCKQYDICISTSLDGPRELHNANRPRSGDDSHERTIQGIAAARAALGGDYVSALMTTTKASLCQPEAIIDEYIKQGFSSIFLRLLSPFGFAVKTGAVASYSVTEWLQFYQRAMEYIINLNRRGIEFREEYATLLLKKILTPFPTGYVDLQSPAGMGISCLAFNYDGSIYASDEARMLAAMGDDTFRLGHLATDSFASVVTSDKLVNYLTETMTESVPMCADCGIQPYCGSDPVYHYATQGDVVGLKPASGFCQKNMEIVRYLIRLLEDDAEAGAILRSWIV